MPASASVLHISDGLTLPAKETQTQTLVVYGGKGMGKRLALDTPLPTPDGWTTMGDVKIGSRLFGPSGEPCAVTYVSPTHLGDSYEIEFSDGSTITADAEHLWLTESYAERRHHRDGKIRSTKEIAETLTVQQGQQTARNHAIRNALPLEIPARSLPIDPYVLGVWLGDGTSNDGTVTAGPDDIGSVVALVTSRGCSTSAHKRQGDRAPHFCILGLKAVLRSEGLLGNKHIPARYLRASAGQRLLLLQGLMDTDGTYARHAHSVQFDNMNERLADGVYELVVSLGMKATRTKKRATLNGIDHGVCHRITFVPTMPVFQLPRKRDLLRFDTTQQLRRVRRYVVAARPVPSVPMRCIQVDSPEHMFLAGTAMIPTHNTNFGTVLAEEFDRCGLRFAWLDPVGVAWGLKHSGDGRGAGVEVLILGGIHGDLPITPTSGAVVADLVVEETISVIVDISRHATGRMWSAGEKIRFVRDYCARLFERQGEERRPLMQIIDEAGRFVPQSIPAKAIDIAECIGAIEQLVELGRNVGVGVALLTQRSARMNKSVSELAEMMIAFRTVGPRSIEAIMDWFGDHIPRARALQHVEQLRELDVGTALVVSPGWLKVEGKFKMRARRTFDSSATPVAGQERRPTGKGATVDLDKLRARLAETIEKAEADDPKKLRAEIARLLRALETRPEPPAPAPVTHEVSRITKAMLPTSLPKGVHDVIAHARRMKTDVDLLVERAEQMLEEAKAEVAATPDTKTIERSTATATERTPQRTESAPKSASPQVTAPPQGDTTTDLGADSAPGRIMAVLAHYPDGLPASRVAAMAGVSRKKSTMRNAVSGLRMRGFLEGSATGMLKATPEGRATFSSAPAPPTGAALRSYWEGQLAEAPRRFLACLIDAYPAALSSDDLADRAGYDPGKSTIRNGVSRLRTLGLLTGSGGSLRADDDLMASLNA